MKISQVTLRFVVLFSFVIFLSLWAIEVQADETAFSGLAKCEGMQIRVTFTYNMKDSTITNFKAGHSCIGKEAAVEYAPKVTISVSEEGTFNYSDRWGNSIKGSISTESMKAHGEVTFTSSPLAICDDGKSYNLCTHWEASSTEKMTPKTDYLLPPFKSALKGNNEVRIRNPNSFTVTVGLRSGNGGKDFEVAANGTASVFVSDGKFETYFVYSNKPDALFKGDDFSLNDNGVEIQIVKVVGGNYGIRRVK